jgi:hypothetical protein
MRGLVRYVCLKKKKKDIQEKRAKYELRDPSGCDEMVARGRGRELAIRPGVQRPLQLTMYSRTASGRDIRLSSSISSTWKPDHRRRAYSRHC